MRTAMRHIHIAVGLTLMGVLTGPRALAEVVAIVSAKSTVTTLSKSEVANIFMGKMARFPDGTLAIPIDQSESAAVRDEFYTKVAGKSPEKMKAHWSKVIFTGRGRPPPTVASSGEAKKRAASNPRIIAYIEPHLVDESVRVVALTQ